MTLRMVTREMSCARKVSDRLAFMRAGRIHEIGSPEQLFDAPQTTELTQSCRRSTTKANSQRGHTLVRRPCN
jgi:ABC-type histidine transport system ATPase subunit